MTGRDPFDTIREALGTAEFSREPYRQNELRDKALTALDELEQENRRLREALVDLRQSADLYNGGHIGIQEFAASMDKAYAALYPTALAVAEENAVRTEARQRD